MSVTGVSSNKAAELGGAQGPRRPNVKALREALQAGDVDAAKEAFAKIYHNVKKAPTDAAHDGIAASLKSLVMAVDAGDMNAAQASLQALDADRASVGYTPGQVPGVVRQAGSDFLGLVRAIRSGDAAAAGAALDHLRDGVKAHFEGKGDTFRIQPAGEGKGEPSHILPEGERKGDVFRIQPAGEPLLGLGLPPVKR